MNFLLNAFVALLLLTGVSAGSPLLSAQTSGIAKEFWWLEEKADSTLPVTDAKPDFAFLSSFLLDVPSETYLTLAAKPVKATIGLSKKGYPITAYYFPGTSNKRALVIGGMHGSELSSFSVAHNVLQELQNGARPYYNVIVIPCLFPDNAQKAVAHPELIGAGENIGRYTHQNAVDPNRQMPSLGQPFDEEKAHDHLGRSIELENQLLLKIIQDFRPERIVNLHGIRATNLSGIYADPRTDSRGLALGFEKDSLLAVSMARFVHQQGGMAPGNQLDTAPTARYPRDPVIVPAQEVQPRATCGSLLPANRGCGVSLGSWASTAVEDAADPLYNRPAITLITVEFPGYKRPQDYRAAEERSWCSKMVQAYAASILHVFLQAS